MFVSSPATPLPAASRALKTAGLAWFLIAAAGQIGFVVFILGYYGVRTISGNFAAWNDKPLIDGYIAGDLAGNAVFAAHVILAAVITLGGLMQLVPAIRRRLPRLHRWTGRLFIGIAVVMALSGIWLVLVRGTFLSEISAAAVLLNGVLILIFVALAWRNAVKRRFEQHRRWAMRLFMVVSGVWFLRVGIMGWVILNQGPAGLTKDMSGPVDAALNFGSYLIPLALLELYLAAGRSTRPVVQVLATTAVAMATLYTAVGVFGTVFLMWRPYL